MIPRCSAQSQRSDCSLGLRSLAGLATAACDLLTGVSREYGNMICDGFYSLIPSVSFA